MKNIFPAFGLLLFPAVSLAAFGDVSSTHANADAITYVKAQGIVSGYPDGSFRPGNTINRAELAKILMEANVEASVMAQCDVSQMGFSDVPADAWFASYVCTAQAQGVIQGYADGTFRPAQNVNFAEAAKMISLSFNESVNADSEVWFAPYVNLLASRKAIPTTINVTNKSITRGEMAEMVYRLQARVENKDSLSFDRDKAKRGEKALFTMNVTVNTEASTTASSDTGETETAAESNTSVEVSVETKVNLGSDAPEYVDYDEIAVEQALNSGKSVALFFHASWCPSCVKADKEIKANTDQLPDNSVVFKVDYDSAKDLRKEYGVTSQHTAVFLDAEQKSRLKKPGFSMKDLASNL